jgi:Amt family ammonium transporter
MLAPNRLGVPRSRQIGIALLAAALLSVPALAYAEDAPPTLADVVARLDANKVMMDTVWTMIAGFLVFFMNAGFALLEAGLCRAKNASTILAKNFIVFAAATVAFWAVGFNLMFSDGSPFLGGLSFLLGDPENYDSLAWTVVPLEAKFFFQLVFAGTAATIVSGCVDERNKYLTFIVFSVLLTAFIYAVPGHWIWGGGWLATAGFWDFAGSTVVHSVGGWAGLAGIIAIGPRLGRYKDGKAVPVPGHSMHMATLGTLILWLGWFGFNPGSTMAADGNAIAHIAMTTNLAGAVGAITATATAWLMLGKPDITMTLNGCLAGLVAITCPCAWVTAGGAFWIGGIAGVLAVLAVPMWDKIKLDDPVGALSVHLVNGVWGTLSLGLFAAPGFAGGEAQPGLGLFYGGGATQLLAQLQGVAAVGAFTFVASMAVWYALKYTMGVRVTEEQEIEGLDIHEIGVEAYNADALGLRRVETPEMAAAAVAMTPVGAPVQST